MVSTQYLIQKYCSFYLVKFRSACIQEQTICVETFYSRETNVFKHICKRYFIATFKKDRYSKQVQLPMVENYIKIWEKELIQSNN